jgi:hypothetical protein
MVNTSAGMQFMFRIRLALCAIGYRNLLAAAAIAPLFGLSPACADSGTGSGIYSAPGSDFSSDRPSHPFDILADRDTTAAAPDFLAPHARSAESVSTTTNESEAADSFLPDFRFVSHTTSIPVTNHGGTTFNASSPQVLFQDASCGGGIGPACTDGTWAIVAPYGWVSGIDGKLASPVGLVNIDLTPSDVLNTLDDVNGAMMLHTEVGRGDCGLILDANIIRLTPQSQLGPAVVDIDISQTLLEFLGMARIVESPDVLVEEKSLTVDLLAGARYYQFSSGVAVQPLPEVVESNSWVDMVVGARTLVPLTSSLDGWLRTDFGGFGVGSSSDFAWNLIAGVDYQCSENTTFAVGYRQLRIDKYSGSGAAAQGFDVTMYGPFLALTFRY